MQLSPRGCWLVAGFAVLTACVVAVTGPGATAQTSPDAPGRLTADSLGEALRSLGLKPTRDRERYDFTFKAVYGSQEWELTMSAVLSQNGDSLWVIAWLDELPRASADVPKTALLRLLANNDRLGKGKFFAYVAANRRFVLQRVVENRNLAAADLRDVLSDLGGSVAETYPYWAVAKWTEEGETPEPPAPLRSVSNDTQYAPVSRQ
jgi:hypothetical protein